MGKIPRFTSQNVLFKQVPTQATQTKKGKEGKAHKYNAKKQQANGIEFDSALERFCHECLSHNDIEFVFQKAFLLLPKHTRDKAFKEIAEELSLEFVNKKGKKINVLRKTNLQDIEIIVDFYIETPVCNIIIETKGFKTADWLLKIKFLESKLAENDLPTFVFLPSTNAQVTKTILKLKDFFKSYNISFIQDDSTDSV